ncbi:hypothetical protein JZ751_029358, partial [Albula glossodonta]
ATLQRIAVLLERNGIDVKDLTPQQLDTLITILQQMDTPQKPDQYDNGATEFMEGAMTHMGEKIPMPAPSSASVTGTQTVPVPARPTSAAPAPTVAVTLGGVVTAQGTTASLGENELNKKVSNALPTVGGAIQSKEEYGYIVTNQSPLSLFDGVRLLETLAERIHLTTSTFINISVVGPALTFRIRQNSQNLSAEDVADKAVAEKTFLEGETGLKIIQTGVG